MCDEEVQNNAYSLHSQCCGLFSGGKNNAQKQSPWLANPSLANPGYQGLLAMHDSEKL